MLRRNYKHASGTSCLHRRAKRSIVETVSFISIIFSVTITKVLVFSDSCNFFFYPCLSIFLSCIHEYEVSLIFLFFMGTIRIVSQYYLFRHSQLAVASESRKTREHRRVDVHSTLSGRRRTGARSASPIGNSQGS